MLHSKDDVHIVSTETVRNARMQNVRKNTQIHTAHSIRYHSSLLGFMFHGLERIFHAVERIFQPMERIFQPMECTFQPVEYKTQAAANRLSALIYCISNEMQEHRAMNNLYEEA